MSSYVIFSYSSYPLALKFVTINSLIKLNVSFFNIILNKDYSKTKEFPREKTWLIFICDLYILLIGCLAFLLLLLFFLITHSIIIMTSLSGITTINTSDIGFNWKKVCCNILHSCLLVHFLIIFLNEIPEFS